MKMNKKKIIASTLAVAFLFVIAMRLPSKPTAEAEKSTKKIIAVLVRSAEESKNLMQKIEYPANIVGDQEIKITAKSAGTIIYAPGNIGDSVKVGSVIAKIDDSSALEAGNQGLKSLQVQQSEIALRQAKESYELAKELYDNLKDSSEATDSQLDSAKAQKDIAKLQYENASLTLNSNVDNRLITSPISGFIINKAVSVGDSVSVGQLLAIVSQSSNIKIQFYVDQTEKKNLARGQEISIVDVQGNSTSSIIRNIASSADPISKRFLVEAYPKQNTGKNLIAGTIATVSIQKNIKPNVAENLLLPLSAIGIGQNENYIFIVENNVARKIAVEVVSVNGENAEISAQISAQTLIVTEGNKLIRDGETVEIKIK